MKTTPVAIAATMIISVGVSLRPAPASAAEPRPFNDYVLAAVRSLEQSQYAHKGYDPHAAFTHDLAYADQCCVTHTPAPPRPPLVPLTMCVAAVEEVILTALQTYYAENPSARLAALQKAPLGLWDKGTPHSLKANLFIYDGTGSRGTGDTLERFGMGKEKHFSDLKAGDFINLNRRHSGHAVVFLAYLDATDTETNTYSPSVIGFKYFSSQGQGKPPPASGLGYRWAYFEDHACPVRGPTDQNRPRDCGIIRSDKLSLLDGGTLYYPEDWDVADALKKMRDHTRSVLSTQHPDLRGVQLEGAVDSYIGKELPEPDPAKYREDTTD